MMNLNGKFWAGLPCLMILTSACSKTSTDCEEFPHQYIGINMPELDGRKIPLESAFIKKASSQIMKCYPQYKYMETDPRLHKIEIVDARAGKAGEYFIVTELYGVTDIVIAFKVDGSGNLLGSYAASYLSGVE